MNKANVENTIFFSVAEYENPDFVTEPLRMTADHFKIPLEFAIYGGKSYRCNSETKFNKILSFLYKQQFLGKEFCLFCDARDVVFVDTAANILNRYNALNSTGVLFNANSFCGTWPCELYDYTKTIVENFGGRGVVNSGVYIGSIQNVISLIQDSINLIENVATDDYDNVLFETLTPELVINFKEHKHKYISSDQFAIQTLQFLSHPLINVDSEKQLFAVFGEKYPLVHKRINRNCFAVNWETLGDDCYIGKAKILHSPWLSKNRIAWITWIKEEIIKY